ncbi:hypothetical protein DITRI_Ditri07aG0160000 [Diplodiscus trichospermus]
MDSELYNIACRGDVNRLYGVIAKNPYVLDNIDKIPFVETPLHVAASRGQTNFAVEIMGLKPSFSKKLNQQGWSPMHLAVQEKMKPTVLRFLETEHGADLVRVKGREGVTSLHYVVEQEDLELLNEFLSVSPDSINDTTNQGETALHIAVKNRKINALDALLVFLRRFCNGETEEKVLNWKDEKGYTVLHVAAESDQRDLRDKITKSLLKYNIHLNARSLSGSTALNILLGGESNDYTETKSLLTGAGASDGHVSKSRGVKPTLKKQLSYKSRLTFLGKLVDFVTKERKGIPLASRDTLLVVSALVATATFQAVLSPPGGLRQADSNSDSLPGKAGKLSCLLATFSAQSSYHQALQVL